MLGHTRSRPKLVTVLGAAVLAASFGCQGESPVTVDGVLLFQAKGGGRGPSVDQAIPNWGEQNQTMDVQVLGSGYDNGSEATFTLDGNPAKIVTDSTTYVSRSELVAHVKVEADADLALHDVEVMTMRGKKGIGADLFQVVQEGAGQPPGQIETIPLVVYFGPAMPSAQDPRSESDGTANRAEILLSGNFQVHWSGIDLGVELDLSESVWLDPNPVKVPQWYPDGDGTCGAACGSLGGYISTGFPRVWNPVTEQYSPLDNGFRDMVAGGEYYTAMHRVWTANNTNWVLHFHTTPDGAPDACSHEGLSGDDMTVRVKVKESPTEPDWQLLPREGAVSPAILCGFAARGKPFNAIVGQFQVPFEFDLVRQ